MLFVEKGKITLLNKNVVLSFIKEFEVVTFQIVTTLLATVIFLVPSVPRTIDTVVPIPLKLKSVGNVTTSWSDTRMGERLIKLKLIEEVVCTLPDDIAIAVKVLGETPSIVSWQVSIVPVEM